MNVPQTASTSRPKSAGYPPNPEIYTLPATPSPNHSPSRASPNHSKSFRMSISRKFTMSSTDSPTSRSPSSEIGDPFQDPPTFQTDASPFAAQYTDDELCSPIEATAASRPLNGPQTSPTDLNGGNGNRAYWNRNRSRSGVMSNLSSTPPTPRSEVGSDEIPRRIEDHAVPRVSTSSSLATHSLSPPTGDKGKGKKKMTSGSNGSRLSLFFRSPVPPPPSRETTAQPRESVSLHPQHPAARRGGLDLLDDGESGDGEFGQVHQPDHRSLSRSGGVQVMAMSEEVISNNQPLDLWEGVGELPVCLFVQVTLSLTLLLQSLASELPTGMRYPLLAPFQIHQNGQKMSLSILSDQIHSSFAHQHGVPSFVSSLHRALLASSPLSKPLPNHEHLRWTSDSSFSLREIRLLPGVLPVTFAST
jgi:hypothetical protein